ncbi:hypothetical protein RFI_14107, partial [Reticulomyxa filosa]
TVNYYLLCNGNIITLIRLLVLFFLSNLQNAFQFFEQGTFVKKATTMRAKALSEDLTLLGKKKKSSGVKNPNTQDIKSVALKMEDETELRFLDEGKRKNEKGKEELSYDDDFRMDMITDLAENPIILRPHLLIMNDVTLPSFLTTKERKKIRRMQKKQKQDEIKSQIIEREREIEVIYNNIILIIVYFFFFRIGVIEPPEPRLKLSNIMRVLGTVAIQDPSAAEAKARAQMEKRKMKHLLHNAEMQLTPMQRREKKAQEIARKYQRKSTRGCLCCQ